MAIFINTSGAKLVLNDEFGLPVCFEPGETKTGISNYLERYTSTYQTGENVFLRRVGNLDPDVNDGGIPVAAIEEENLAVKPSQPNNATNGVYWGIPGKSNTAITAGYTDTVNTSERLKRIVFDTSIDTRKRQIDTRYLGVKNRSELDIDLTFVNEVDIESPVGVGTKTIDIEFTSGFRIKQNGRLATTDDTANPTYGSLLIEDVYYTAFGVLYIGSGPIYSVGFALRDSNNVVFGTNDSGWTLIGLEQVGNSTLQLSMSGPNGENLDVSIEYTELVALPSRVNIYYQEEDEIRGWYSDSYGTLLLTDNGILSVADSATTDFLAWS